MIIDWQLGAHFNSQAFVYVGSISIDIGNLANLAMMSSRQIIMWP